MNKPKNIRSALPQNATAIIGTSLLAINACHSAEPESPSQPSQCIDNGFLKGQISGSLNSELNWQASSMQCESMPRPDNSGLRLRITGPLEDVAENAELTIIIGLPELVEGENAKELSSNVTLFQEGSGRFYSNNGIENCWADLTIEAIQNTDRRYKADAMLYCIAALAEVNGDGAINLSELTFSSVIDWTPVE